MSLPLLGRTADASFCRVTTGGAAVAEPALRAPGAGEQYRFHFDMTKCIGCKCCEVACSEQNNNPVEIQWRRVGELEGGIYPLAERFHLSMGCNHCLEPACLIGCPVDAYSKDLSNGIVLHSAEICIGCQYCTWNCPYGVPQFNEERGVVGKCDMCHNRLSEGRSPACVSACPQEAIEIELVNIAEWRATGAFAGNAPGLPPAEHTMSTTRITLPEGINQTLKKADYHRVRPEHPHWPLVFLLVLTQMAVGGFVTLLALGSAAPKLAFLLATAAGHAALGFSLLHLGRPAHAPRAMKMWRRSWLSREVLFFTLFAGASAAAASAAWFGSGLLLPLHLAAVVTGLAGVVASAYIYMVPARPAWNTMRTLAEFVLTGAVLGLLTVAACGANETRLWASAAAVAQAALFAGKVVSMRRAYEFELRQSARLLERPLRRHTAWRLGLLLLVAAPVIPAWIALPVALGGEILGRYLFFVSVVPRNMALSFFSGSEAA
ncbi:MAG TPA: DmsC/YnfH family molybdoenzyme membrane anchor subunit [Paludibaculum sp.]|jgi:DMSO reductase iron-sulfur subunit